MSDTKQIGWGVDTKLLSDISERITRLTKVQGKKNEYIDTLLPTVWSEEYWLSVYNSYERPTDWLPIAPLVVDGDQKVVMLHAIFQDSNFCALQCAANYTVDWGDGVVENFAANVSAYHVFSYSSFPGTESSLGYRQAIVTVTPQAGQNLTKVDLSISHNQTNLGTNYSSGWLDIKISGSFISTFSLARQTNYLEIFDFIGTNLITSTASLFTLCKRISHIISFDTSSVTNMTSMFQNCLLLKTIPLLNTSSVTNMSTMFVSCILLKTISLLDTSSVTNMTGMFQNCSKLKTIPLLNTGSVTNMSTMFDSCVLLETIPLLNTSNVTSMSTMFNSCSTLSNVPLFNTSNVISINNMFAYCSALKTVPFFDTSSVTNMQAMFANCSALKTVPLFNTSNVTNISNMLQSCGSLITVPFFDTSSATLMSNMFLNCNSLITIPLFDTSSVTNIASMFQGCSGLTSVPLFDTSSVNYMDSMFRGCFTLITVPLFNTINVTSMPNMFNGCTILEDVPAFDITNVTSMPSMFSQCYSLTSVLIKNIGASPSVAGCKLSKPALETIFKNLKNNTFQTTTVTSNWGSLIFSYSNISTVAGSATLGSFSSTTGLLVGMLVYGTNITSPAKPVTFTDIGDLVNRANHTLENGTKVAFSSIVTTTGLSLNTIYYVVNKTTNDFQVSLTPGGSPITLTTNGTGTVNYPSFIVSIGVNSIDIDHPAIASNTKNSIICSVADFSFATLKGSAVTG